MSWLWTWKGKSFGYRRGNELRLQNGMHIGTFIGDEIYGIDGKYLGEVRNESRLIVRKASKGKSGPKVSRKMKLVAQVGRVNMIGLVGLVGYEDFPSPETFIA
ncbi:hypothetical protein MID00_16570 [Alcaligenes sp. NLF5-7]|uniref:hypothetical protein n=1 Tax=Alcaligenes sp. NLF5-7 TaxID=2918755 RepID=UPI0020C38A03|nr:hypothetical protein [Alcaligenes sp. NLF5-7]UTM01091.1 hypothetical protein MID00_16570 [Alcaligenes sp. NLF5-7]